MHLGGKQVSGRFARKNMSEHDYFFSDGREKEEEEEENPPPNHHRRQPSAGHIKSG